MGFREASVGAVASEAGYSHSAIYSDFKDKDELFLVPCEEAATARNAAEVNRGQLS